MIVDKQTPARLIENPSKVCWHIPLRGACTLHFRRVVQKTAVVRSCSTVIVSPDGVVQLYHRARYVHQHVSFCATVAATFATCCPRLSQHAKHVHIPNPAGGGSRA